MEGFQTGSQAFGCGQPLERTHMQVSVEEVSSVKKILHIEIPQDQIQKELDSAYGELKKNAKVKGFRQGKVPRGVLERLYGKEVHLDVSSKLIQSSFQDAIKETELKMVGLPSIEPPELNPKASYAYDATVHINPEITDIEFKGLKLKKNEYPVDDSAIEVQLKMLQKNLARMQPIDEDREARPGDVLLLDYEGFKDGKPFSETQKTENFTMKLGDSNTLAEFNEHLPGMKPGEAREIRVTFPEDQENTAIAGQTIDFTVTLKEIREEILPPLDDELAKNVGHFQSLSELKASIQEDLKRRYEKRTEHELNEQIFSALIDRAPFEVPAPLIDYEMDQIVSDTERTFAQRDMSMAEAGLSRETLTEKYRDVAEKQARRHLILSKIASQENLEVSEGEIDDSLREMAEAYHQPFEVLKKQFLAQPDRMSFFKETLLEKKAIQLIIRNSDIETVTPEAQA
jgi:trigger factor